ncbi:pyruvate formate lyase-activating protein [Spirochaetia bacterium]|nr:pyruvate formate lyase-activating protein [Spirochaetia bacterium]
MSVTAFLFNIQKFSLHDGPGIRTVVFFAGCPLSCRWCSNPESQQTGSRPACDGVPASREYSLEETLEICLQDRPFYEESSGASGERGGVTLSGGEVFLQPVFASALLRALKDEKIHTAIETSAYTAPGIFAEVTALVDLLLFDLKHYDDLRHMEGTGVHNEPILANLRSAISAGKTILPRIPVIPGFNDTAEDACGFTALLNSLGLNQVQLLPFHQFGEKKYTLLGLPYSMQGITQLHPEDLEAYRQIFLDGGITAFM